MQKVIKTTTHTPHGKEAGVRFHEIENIEWNHNLPLPSLSGQAKDSQASGWFDGSDDAQLYHLKQGIVLKFF